MKKITASQQRLLDNATLIAALQLIFISLEKAHFPLYKLEEIADTTSGGTPDRRRSEYYEGNIPWIKSGELNDGIIQNCEEYITEEGLQNSSAKIYPKDTLVVALYGATVGKTGILAFEAASNQAVCAIFPKQKDINKEFIFWYLRHKRPEFLQSSFGAAQPNISQRVLRSTTLPIPPIELQEIICSYLEIVESRQRGRKEGDLPVLPEPLSHINTTITQIEEVAAKIEEARGLKTGQQKETEFLLESILKRTRLNLMQGSAHKKKLDDITTITSGGTPSRSMISYWNGDIPWIKTGELLDGDIYQSEESLSEEGLENSSAKLFPLNTILIALYGQGQTRGRTGRLMVEASTNQACCAILPNPSLLNEKFTQYWLRSLYTQMRETAYGGAQPNWNSQTIKNIEIALPSLAEQECIVSYFDSIQKQISILRCKQAETSAELNALLPSILDKAFKGEL